MRFITIYLGLIGVKISQNYNEEKFQDLLFECVQHTYVVRQKKYILDMDAYKGKAYTP